MPVPTFQRRFLIFLLYFYNIFIILVNSEPEGISILYDGQKQYPTAKVTVDFTFVEHTEFDCIEIIGICIPFESISKNASADSDKNNLNITAINSIDKIKSNRPVSSELSSSSFCSPVRPKSMESKSLEYLLNSGGTTGLYNMTLEEKQSLPIIRVFIAAKVFYERIIINKKVKDKKNRRMEQVMTVRSKLTQNMAAQSLLGT